MYNRNYLNLLVTWNFQTMTSWWIFYQHKNCMLKWYTNNLLKNTEPAANKYWCESTINNWTLTDLWNTNQEVFTTLTMNFSLNGGSYGGSILRLMMTFLAPAILNCSPVRVKVFTLEMSRPIIITWPGLSHTDFPDPAMMFSGLDSPGISMSKSSSLSSIAVSV